MRLLIFFLLITLGACGQQSQNQKHSIDPKAGRLNDSALAIMAHSEDYDKAIALLDQAIAIDSNFYLAFWNKTNFQLELNQFDSALATVKNLNRIKPESPDYFFLVGIIDYKMGDTISSQRFFQQSENRYESILDTMNTSSKQYRNMLMTKAVNLKIIGQQQEGNAILKTLLDSEKDDFQKEMINSMMTESKERILDDFIQRK
ncbi:MAG: tetratricopeptide repeat protein [Ginsengibacter sp.]